VSRPIVAVFDFDGTLVDSDEALIAPFLALGVDRSRVRLGRLLVDECDDHGVTVEDYLDHYDPSVSDPFPGIDELLTALPRWGLCSNKHPDSGASELARLGWHPTATAFALGAPKSLLPVLTDLGVSGADVLYVGDTDHDRECAGEVGATFALAGWNRRARPEPGDVVLNAPADVLDLLA
jgi:phosphoglycolate phosphatase-like HAD superfamily hydrolase